MSVKLSLLVFINITFATLVPISSSQAQDNLEQHSSPLETFSINKNKQCIQQMFSTFRQGLFHSSIHHGTTCLQNIQDLTSKKYVLLTLSQSFFFTKNHLQSKKFATLLMKISKNDDYFLGHTFNQFGQIQNANKKFQSALSHYKKAQQHFQNNHNEFERAIILHNIAETQANLGFFNKAHNLLIQAIAIKKKFPTTSLSLGKTYFLFGNLHFQEEQYDQALSFYNQALGLLDKSNNIFFLGILEHQIAVTQTMNNNLNQASLHAKKSIAIALKTNDYIRLCERHLSLGIIQMHSNLIKESGENIQQALKILAHPKRYAIETRETKRLQQIALQLEQTRTQQLQTDSKLSGSNK